LPAGHPLPLGDRSRIRRKGARGNLRNIEGGRRAREPLLPDCCKHLVQARAICTDRLASPASHARGKG
jgi:hypothetical protein